VHRRDALIIYRALVVLRFFASTLVDDDIELPAWIYLGAVGVALDGLAVGIVGGLT